MRPERDAPIEAASTVVSFTVTGEASPHLIGRLTGLVAQRGLTPLAISMRRDGDHAHVELMQDNLPLESAIVIAEKMRSLVIVASVTLRYTCSINGYLP